MPTCTSSSGTLLRVTTTAKSPTPGMPQTSGTECKRLDRKKKKRELAIVLEVSWPSRRSMVRVSTRGHVLGRWLLRRPVNNRPKPRNTHGIRGLDRHATNLSATRISPRSSPRRTELASVTECVRLPGRRCSKTETSQSLSGKMGARRHTTCN
mgnify:CR=1 FL=1